MTTVFDYLFLGLLGVSALVGLWRGLVSEVIALVGWVAALLAAWFFAGQVSPMLEGVVAQENWRHVTAFALVFVGVLFLAAVLRFLLRELLRAAGLGAVDRFFGVLFGLARGLLIALVLVGAGGLVGMAAEPWWVDSLFAPPLETGVIAAKPWLPDVLAERISFR